jgi:hypothetical protein
MGAEYKAHDGFANLAETAKIGPNAHWSGIMAKTTLVAVALAGAIANACSASTEVLRAKSNEARMNVQRIWSAALAYYEEEHVGPDGKLLPKQFPTPVATTPAGTPCDGPNQRYRPDPKAWEHPTWKALRFSMTEPHYYRYAFDSSGTGTSAQFTAHAHGDLNCDGVWSTFEKIGFVDKQGKLQRGSGLYANRPLE